MVVRQTKNTPWLYWEYSIDGINSFMFDRLSSSIFNELLCAWQNLAWLVFITTWYQNCICTWPSPETSPVANIIYQKKNLGVGWIKLAQLSLYQHSEHISPNLQVFSTDSLSWGWFSKGPSFHPRRRHWTNPLWQALCLALVFNRYSSQNHYFFLELTV